MKCVILAGGSGSRFWPYSRNQKPKQLLNIVGGKSMLQITIDRLKKIKLVDEIYIITRKDLFNLILDVISGIPKKNIIVEPSGKNTAPAIGMMAALFAMNDEKTVMGVFPADHLRFWECYDQFWAQNYLVLLLVYLMEKELNVFFHLV